MINLAISFLLLHLLADFPLQGEFLAKGKATNAYLMFAHCAIYAGVMWIGWIFWGLPAPGVAFLLILYSHWMIDWWKCNVVKPKDALTIGLWIDQALHIIVLAINLYGALLVRSCGI